METPKSCGNQRVSLKQTSGAWAWAHWDFHDKSPGQDLGDAAPENCRHHPGGPLALVFTWFFLMFEIARSVLLVAYLFHIFFFWLLGYF